MKIKFLLVTLGLCSIAGFGVDAQIVSNNKPKIAFTFDDGQTNDFPGYKLEEWNELLISHLQKHGLKAILFSSGANKTDEKGK